MSDDYLDSLREKAERGEYMVLGLDVIMSPIFLPFYLVGRLAAWVLGVDRGEDDE